MLDLLQRTALPMRWEPVQVIKMRGMSLSERLTTAETKLCRACMATLHVSLFNPVWTRNTFSYRCKSCSYLVLIKHRQSEGGAAALKRRAAHYRSTEKSKEYQKRYRKEHPETVRAANKRYRQSHLDEIRAKARISAESKDTSSSRLEYLISDRGACVIKAQNHRRRLRTESAGSFSTTEWESLKAYFGNHCGYCGIYCERPTIEHMVPICLGGTNAPDNIIPACRSCNCSKGKKNLLEWLRMRTMTRYQRRKSGYLSPMKHVMPNGR